MQTEEQKKAAQKEYVRSWRKAHPDRVAVWQLRYWTRRAEELNSDEEVTGGHD